MCSTVIPPAFPCSPSTSSRFCRDSAISLSLFYNNGAQPCRCHEAGARGSQCEPFGGQCPCKSNVIGRECSRCATGYWGFPNCRRELSHLLLCFLSTCCFASYRAEADLGNGCIFRPCNGSTCMKTPQLPAEQLRSASIASCSPWAAWVLLSLGCLGLAPPNTAPFLSLPACDCGTRLCDEVTGQCICPPHTLKPECVVCEPQTFGCHPLIGCEDCNCSRPGVQELTEPGCDVDSGQCR